MLQKNLIFPVHLHIFKTVLKITTFRNEKYSKKEHGTWGKRTGNITASILTQTEHMCSKC